MSGKAEYQLVEGGLTTSVTPTTHRS